MSDVIENQIVQMSFDNKEFEKNISTSMKSLDEFKKEMEFSEEASNFKELEKVSESVDFDKLNKAVDNVGNHFTLIGRIGYKVVDDLASYFTNKIESMVNSLKSVTVDILDPKAGYAKYDEYTHGVKSIIAALSDTEVAKLESSYASVIDGVEDKLDGLMAYTDETSYDFVTMVGTIGKFLGAGIELDSAIADMQGIANWAALAGQNATTASQAMYQMSQALGAGYVKYMDWAQMANMKNMGTTVAKDTFIEAARELGYIQDEDIAKAKEMTVAAGGAAENWRNWFYEAKQLNEQQWFKTEVLESGLQKFSTVSNEVINLIGDVDKVTATSFLRAGKKVKAGTLTVSDAVSQLASDYNLTDEEIKKVTESMEKCTSVEYELGWKAFLAAQEAVTFREAIDATKDAVGTTWMRIFSDLIGNYEEAAELWTDLANNLWDTFAYPLTLVEAGLREWSGSTITIIDETGKEVEVTMRKYMWEGLSDVFAGFGNLIGSLFTSINNFSDKTLSERVVSFFDKITYGLHSFADTLNRVAESETMSAMSKLFRDLITLGSTLFDIFRKIISAIWQGVFGGDALDEALSAGVFTIDSLVVGLTHLLDKFNNSKGFAKTLTIVKTLIQGVVAVLRVFTTAIWALADLIRGKFSIASVELKNAFIGLWEWIAKIFKFDASKGAKAFESAFDIIGKGVKKLTSLVKEFFSYWADNFSYWIHEIVNSEFIISGVVYSIIDLVGTLVSDVIEAIASIFGFDASEEANKIYSFFNKAANIAKKAIEKVAPGLQNAFYGVSSFIFEGIPNAFTSIINAFKNGVAGQTISDALKTIGDWIKAGVSWIIDGVSQLIGFDLEPFKSKILSFIDGFTKSIERIKPGFAEAWEKIGELFDKLVEVFKKLADALFDIISQATGIENFGPEKILDLLFWILEKLVGILVWVVTTAGTIIVQAYPFIVALGSLIYDGFCQVFLALKKLIGMDNSDEAAQALENLKKVLLKVLAVILILEVYKFFKAIKWMIESVAGVADMVTGWKPTSLMNGIGYIVKSVAFLLIALSILSNQDISGIAMGLIAFTIMFKLMMKFLKILMDEILTVATASNMLGANGKALDKATQTVTKVTKQLRKMLLSIAVAVSIIAIVTHFTSPEDMTTAVMTMALILTIMVYGIKAIVKATSQMDKNSKQLDKANSMLKKVRNSMIKMGVSLALIIKVIDATSEGDEGIVEEAITYLVTSLAILVGGTFAITTVTGFMDASSVEKSAGTIAKAGGALGFIALALAGTAWLLANATDEQLLNSMALAVGIMLGIAAAVALFATAINKIMSPTIEKQMDNAATEGVKILGKVLVAVAATHLMVISIISILGTIAVLYYMIDKWKPTELIGALGGAALIVFAAIEIFKLLGELNIGGTATQLLAFSVEMLAFAAACMILAAALGAISLIGLDGEMLKGLLIIMAITVGMTTIMSIAAGLFSAAIGEILAFAAAIGFMALGMFAISAALMLMSLVDTDCILKAALAIGFLLSIMLGLTVLLSVISPAVVLIQAISSAVLKFAVAVALLLVVIVALSYIDKITDDLTNALWNLNDKLPELVEALVTVLVTLINSLADSLMDHAEELGEGLYKLLLAIVGVVFTLLAEVWENALGPFLETCAEFFEDIWHEIQWIVEMIVDAITWPWKQLARVWGMIVDGIETAWNWLLEFFGIASPAKKLIEVGVNIITGLWDGIKETAAMVWGWICDLFVGLWNSICEVFATVYDFFCDVITSIWDGISDTVKKVRDWISNKIQTIWNVIKAPFTAAFDLGKDIVEGLWNGINDMVDWICEKIKSFCKNALDAIKAFFGISSPSKVMAEMGGYLMEGFGEGVEDNQGVAIDACEEASVNMLEEMQDVLGIHSASTETKGMGLNLMQGFENGINGGAGDLLNTVKAVGGDVLSSLSGALGGSDVLGLLTGNLSATSIEMPDIEMPEMDVSNFNIDGYTYNGQAFDPNSIGLTSVYDMDIGANYNGAGLNIPATYTPTVTDAQIDQISSSYEDNSQEVINTLNDIKKQLAEQAEIMSKYQMVLDTGVLVGELATPIDRAIGNKARLANGRGI